MKILTSRVNVEEEKRLILLTLNDYLQGRLVPKLISKGGSQVRP